MHICQGTICYGFFPPFFPFFLFFSSTSVVYIVLLSLKIEEHCLNVLCLMGRMCWCWRKSWPTWVVCVLLHSWGETSLCLQVRFLPHTLLLTHSLTHSHCLSIIYPLSLPPSHPPPPLSLSYPVGCVWLLMSLMRFYNCQGGRQCGNNPWQMLTNADRQLFTNYC